MFPRTEWGILIWKAFSYAEWAEGIAGREAAAPVLAGRLLRKKTEFI